MRRDDILRGGRRRIGCRGLQRALVVDCDAGRDRRRSADGVSCGTPTFCVAVDTAGRAIVHTASGWAAPTIASPTQLDQVSCAGASFCLASTFDEKLRPIQRYGLVDADRRLRRRGALLRLPDVLRRRRGIGLRHDLRQRDVDDFDEQRGSGRVQRDFVPFDDVLSGDGLRRTVETYTNGTWTTPDLVDSAGFASVSCSASTRCIAVDYSGAALNFDGTTWSAPEAVTYAPLTSVSCPTSTLCVAVDSSG